MEGADTLIHDAEHQLSKPSHSRLTKVGGVANVREMRILADPVSRTDRVASTAAASGVTIATVLLIFTSAPRFTTVPADAATRPTATEAHRLTYVSPAAAPPVTRVRPPVRADARASRRPRVVSPMRTDVAPPLQHVAADSSASAPPASSQAHSAVSEFERRWTAHGVSPLLVPGSSREPAYAGGATSSGATVHVPTAGIDRDAQLRAQAQEAMAARAAGDPMSPTPQGGIRIDAPIPFGGPSRAQRKRDSTINAQTKAVLVRVRQRLDSIAAARRRQHADSAGAVEQPR